MQLPQFPPLLLLCLMSPLTFVHADWEKLPPLPEPAGGVVAGTVGGRIIVAGGTNWRGDVKRWLDTVWVSDPATHAWSTGPALPHPVAYAASGSDGSRLFFAGGADGKQARREVYALDAQLRLTRIAELPQPVVFCGGALRGGTLFVLGGTPDPDDWSKGGNQFHAVRLDDGKSTTLAPLKALPQGIGIPALAASASGIHTFTGAWLENKTTAHNIADALTHDAAADTWRSIAPCPEAIRGVAAVALDGHRIYLAGGYGTDAEGFIARAWIYDVRTDRYSTATPLPLAVNTTLVRCGDFIHLLGGEDQKKHRTDACWRIRISALLEGK